MSVSETKLNRGSLPMSKLTFPLIGEQFFRILVSSVDTFMLSSYSASAVAGVGLVSQWIFFLTLMFNVIVIGTTIVLSQYLGAEKSDDELNHVVKAGFIMVMSFSAFFLVLVSGATGPLLNCYTLENEVRENAFKYFIVFGGIGAPFTALNLFQASVLRSYGYTKETLIVTIISNLINVAGNGLAIYGWFGLPVTGAVGVASASVAANITGIIIMFFMIKKRSDIQFRLFNTAKVPSKIFRLILSIGIPSAGESVSYNVAQIVIMAMISTMGTKVMSAQVYTSTIVRFVYVIAVAIGSAVQIKTGYYVGAGEKDTAWKNVFLYSLIATGTSVFMILILNLNFIKNPVVALFTKDREIASLTAKLLLFSIYIEFGRSLNLIYVGALKGAGDVKFPVFYGIFSMWGIMVFLSWLLGIKFGLGIVGCWLGTGTDETTRGIVMLLRWKNKRWQQKAIV